MRRSGVYSVGNSEGTARAGRRAAPPSIEFELWRHEEVLLLIR
jgi:hypothetical protein